jgi:hypothetical protein
MSPLDALVAIGLVGVAAWPAIAGSLTQLKAAVQPRPAAPSVVPAAGSSTQEWRQAWATTLIQLCDEIEVEGHGPLDNPEAAARLARELLWQIIGGGSSTPAAKK